jgi:hypothetical protein
MAIFIDEASRAPFKRLRPATSTKHIAMKSPWVYDLISWLSDGKFLGLQQPGGVYPVNAV